MAQIVNPIGVDYLFQGNIGFGPTGSLTMPNNTINNAQVAPGAGILPSKIASFQQHAGYEQSAANVIGADTAGLYISRNAGTILDVDIVFTGAIATDPSRIVAVDVQMNTGSGYATILNNGADSIGASTVTLGVPIQGDITTTTFPSNASFRAVVGVAGGSGTQAKGLNVVMHFQENPG